MNNYLNAKAFMEHLRNNTWASFPMKLSKLGINAGSNSSTALTTATSHNFDTIEICSWKFHTPKVMKGIHTMDISGLAEDWTKADIRLPIRKWQFLEKIVNQWDAQTSRIQPFGNRCVCYHCPNAETIFVGDHLPRVQILLLLHYPCGVHHPQTRGRSRLCWNQ